MFLSPWQLPIPRMSETDVGGDGGGAAPAARQPAAPQTSVGDGGGRETQAEKEHRLRAEAAANRVEARKQHERAEQLAADLEKAKTEAERRVTEEVGKVTPKLEKMRATLVGAELKAAASAAGLVDLDLLHLPALDRSKIKVNEETGEVEGVAEAVAAFKAAKPDYFRAAAAAGAGNGGGAPPAGAPGGGQPPPARTGAAAPPAAGGDGVTDVRKMTKEQYADWRQGMQRRVRGR